MKQAYEKYMGTYNWEFREIEVLPKCKSVTQFGFTQDYQLVRRKVFFGLIPKVYWVAKRNIKWYDEPTVKYYDCSCGD